MELLAIALLAVLLPADLLAANRWTSIGPYGGGGVTTIAIDPHTPSTLFAVTFTDGIRKSVDRGASWFSIGRTAVPLSVLHLAIDPSGSGTLFAADGYLAQGRPIGVFKSVDGGLSWTAANSGLPEGGVGALLVAPGSPPSVFVEVNYLGVFRSRDGGATWTAASDGLPLAALGPLAVDPSSPQTLYAATGQGLFKTNNGGISWGLASTDLATLNIARLAIAPSAPSTLYISAAFQTHTLFKSTDGGRRWTPADSGLPEGKGEAFALTVDPGDASTVYAGIGSQLFRTNDGGTGWLPTGVGLGDDFIEDIAIDAASRSTLYVATYFGGIFRSGDRGATWTSANVGITRLGVSALAFDGSSPRNLFAATNRGGFRSRNGGNDWVGFGAEGFGGIGTFAVSPEPGTTYAAGDGGIFKTTDGGITWLPTGGGPPYVNALAVDPVSPKILYAGTGGPPYCPSSCLPLPAPGVYKSTDGGATWVSAGLQNIFVYALVIDPTAPSLIYAGTGSGVFRSTDGASSWLDASGGLSGAIVSAVVMDTRSPRALYAGTSAGAFKSDSGVFWTPVNAGLTATRVSALALDPMAVGTIYAGTAGGVFRSTDAGSSWQALNDGLRDLHASSLAVDPSSSTVYAGTSSSGVFRLASGGSSVCGGAALCLLDERFEVRASFRSGSSSLNTLAGPLVLTSSTGAFWFFSPDNLELVVKVLDGRSVNGHFWVFYGSLTNVEFTLTVTDTLTGSIRTYFNPQGQMASVADTSAF